ncbi:MAG TPA: hypothetical protein VFJ30_08345 [Phycisphaerae bacterium]|nr:hypothetical protein [Phycisphaerae bacterium]
MRTGRIATTVSGALVMAAAAWSAAQDTRPASGPATAPTTASAASVAERIEPFLKVIQESDDYREVMGAHARATAIDRMNVAVHKAYMRRMLRMGLPQIAFYPAQILTRLGVEDGTAWGVVGYHYGKRGDLVEAFTATMRAVELTPDDPSILHNAGQLAAWYEEDPSLPRVPDSTRRQLARMRGRLEKNAIFARAHKEVAEAYRKRGQAARQIADQIAAAEDAVESSRLRAVAVDRELRRLNAEIDDRNDEIDKLWRELRQYYGPRTVRDPNGNIIVLPPRDPERRRQLYDRISEGEKEVSALREQVRQGRRDGEAVLGELARYQKELKRLQEQAEVPVPRSQRDFRWDPPAVEGVVTDELDALPALPPAAKTNVPVDPEQEADKRLELAKLYLRNEMSDKAVDILLEITREFPETRAGKQAKVLLAALRPSP